jgi:hypothetical protein
LSRRNEMACLVSKGFSANVENQHPFGPVQRDSRTCDH